MKTNENKLFGSNKDVESHFTPFVNVNIKNEPFRNAPIDDNLLIDKSKISSITYFHCILSMLDAFAFAYSFSMIHPFSVQLKWDLQEILLSRCLMFLSPTAWLLPFCTNSWFFKGPLGFSCIARFGQVFGFGMIVLSIYQAWFW